jgi:phage repressor protein C with HTH and peptisase S24 domain
MDRIAKRLMKIRLDEKRSQREMAELVGVPQTTWSSYESGKTEVSLRVIIKLGELGYSLNWILKGEGKELSDSQELKPFHIFHEPELSDGAFVVPFLDRIYIPLDGIPIPDNLDGVTLIKVPLYLLRYGKDLAALAIEGDSMMPTLHREDIVVCDLSGWSGDGIYVIKMEGIGMVRRITKIPGKIIIISDNPKYPSHEVSEESENLEIIGRVHCAMIKFE